MNSWKSSLALLLSLVAVIAALYVSTTAHEQDVQKISAYDRIMKTRTVRCAYQTWPPFIIKDPNTGKISGVVADIFETMGKDLGLKIDWAEEVGSANMFEGFPTGRYDMFCSPLTMTPQRAMVSDFTRPIGFVPFYLYVKEGDHRFDHNYGQVNDEKVSIMFMDGDFTGIVANELFPKARKVSLPNFNNGGDLLVGVSSLKADATVNDPSIADVFMKNNPGKIRRVDGAALKTPPINFALPVGEDKLRRLVDHVITNYLEVGIIDNILKNYGLDEAKILRVAPPYIQIQEPKGVDP
ncbi:MAG: transporter substrate-binding domain-containing protein [Proteobacteria bacterium]|jgi:ABC-type amino acid transport substrate-binding protein|nr:transporter substrate-binding domain-containing protein [Alphaproteobacteria bacterium]NCC02922.1 transporter substrate-binding domain-containing protein [Pseudomonadota bacterium]